MNIQLFAVYFLIGLIFSLSSHVEATSYPIVYPKGSNLHLKTCETDIDCTFTKTQKLSGKYYFGFDPVDGHSEHDGYVTLTFYPDDNHLPYFKGWNIKSLNITNYLETAEKLIGKSIAKKAIASGRAVKPDKADHPPVKVIVVKGTAEIVVGCYSMGICCDSSYANAKVLQVMKKSKPEVLEENAWGP